MKIVFSDHAKDQVKRRKISLYLVKKTARNPEVILPSFRGRKLLRARFSDKIVEVVAKEEGAELVIVTAYYLKENNL